MIDTKRLNKIYELASKLGISKDEPVKWHLLHLALTHPSVSKEKNYQQLEFIGDAVVRLAAAELLWETYPEGSVGDFASVRSVLVSDRTLAEIAQKIELEKYLLISNAAAGDSAGRTSRLADSFEAILGALYISSGNMHLVRPWLDPILENIAQEVFNDPARQNYKDAVQEWTQAEYKRLPEYRVQEEPGHQKDSRFIAEVWVQQKCLGKGTGQSKKAAEQAAAKEAFLAFVKNSEK